MLNRRVTRTILNSTETTLSTQDLSSSDLTFELTTSDFFYVGFFGRFASRYFNLSTTNSNATVLSVEQWTGTQWVDVEDLVDETQGFQRSGFIHWNNGDQWDKVAQSPIDETELFWIRMSVSADLSVGTKLRSCINLYSDDKMLREIYPELINDTRYLPEGRTDFLEQHLTAKKLVAHRLKQKKLIEDESMIIDINPVSVAAVHACAYYIFFPISTNDVNRQFRDDAEEALDKEIKNINLNIDADRDGKVEEIETRDNYTGVLTRR